MAPFSGDGVLWLCLGVSLVFAIRGIIQDLRQVVDLTKIKHVEKEDKIISEGTEEVLKLDTLLTLSESTSYDLRSAALRIISERSLREQSRDLILEDLASKVKIRQERALTALHFFVTNRALSRTTICEYLRDLETFTALVTCLCNFLEEHTEQTSTTISPILPKTRPLGENKALLILNLLLPDNVPVALEAGLVSRWLNAYPFPCASEQTPSRRQDAVILMKAWWSDDSVMSSIFDTLTAHPAGAKELRKHGLMGAISEDDEDADGDDHEADDLEDDEDDDDAADGDVRMVDGEDTAGPIQYVPSRVQEFSAEDQALRRRRREAMVLSEGGRPLGREDIIQRPI